MPDILLRNVDANLKRLLAEQAQRHNRSLSDEVKALLRLGLSQPAEDEGKGVGTWLKDLIPPEFRGDLELPSRDQDNREAPDFS